MSTLAQPDVAYISLARILDLAYRQSANGKGKDRHATDNHFEDQPICEITRQEGHGFARGQAIKKIMEAKRLQPIACVRELLGAIVYLSADVIVYAEEQGLDMNQLLAAVEGNPISAEPEKSDTP